MFLALFERRFGRRIDYDDVVFYDLGRSLDLTPEQLDEFMVAAHDEEALLSIEPIEGALEMLGKWAEVGYTIDVVTGRPTETDGVSQQWLDRFGVPHHHLTFVDKYGWKDSVFARNSAIPLTELPRADYCLVVEDSAAVASRMVELVDAPVVLVDKPWNRELRIETEHAPGRVTRCSDWDDIGQRFRSP